MSFTFLIPKKIIFGSGSIDSITDVLRELDSKRPIIVTSKGMVKREGFLKLICSADIVFDKVEPEPTVRTVDKCLKVVKNHSSDLVIGLGGGSVMDVAKKVAMDLGLPKLMMPTTAGSGSEVTHESVIKVDGKKRGIVEENLLADVVIVDPDLMMTMPEKLIASSGIDAIAHAIESNQCKRANGLTRVLSHNAYLLMKNNIRRAVNKDPKAIVNMALGSMTAGMSFGNSGTTLAHALAYPLSSMGISHGEAVAIVLPWVLEFNRFSEDTISDVKNIIQDINLPTSINKNIIDMAYDVMEDERHLSNNPREVTINDVAHIYDKIYDGA